MGVDWNELSYHELLSEARKRGIGRADALDRASPVEAIRASDERRGPLSFARALLGRVVRAVIPVSDTERRSDRPPPMQRPDVGESGGTRLGAQTEIGALVLPAAAAALLADPAFSGVRVLDDGALAIVWRVSGSRLEAAQAIAHASAEMHLRTVRVCWPERDGEPRVTKDDHGAVRTEGALALSPRARGEKIVAAIGLSGADGAFVSIDHGSDPAEHATPR